MRGTGTRGWWLMVPPVRRVGWVARSLDLLRVQSVFGRLLGVSAELIAVVGHSTGGPPTPNRTALQPPLKLTRYHRWPALNIARHPPPLRAPIIQRGASANRPAKPRHACAQLGQTCAGRSATPRRCSPTRAMRRGCSLAARSCSWSVGTLRVAARVGCWPAWQSADDPTSPALPPADGPRAGVLLRRHGQLQRRHLHDDAELCFAGYRRCLLVGA